MEKKTKAKIQLSDHFTFWRLVRFALPSIFMMIFMSIYSVVDGLFISNYAGKAQFTGVNLMWPTAMILNSIGFMFGTGGSALIGKLFGENNPKKANEVFTMTVAVTALAGIALGVIAYIFAPQIATLMGAEGDVHTYATQYGRWLYAALPFAMLQYQFQGLFNAAEKPTTGMIVTFIAGGLNILMDGLFVGVFGWGLTGAAAATTISMGVGGVIPLIYFFVKNPSKLRFVKFKIDWKALGRVCSNGASELLANIAMSLVAIFYNLQLLKLIGEDGVAAYGVLAYLQMVFSAVFMGFSIAASPITSYHYGAQNKEEMRSVLAKALTFIGGASLAMVALAEGLAAPLAKLFVGYDEGLLTLTIHAFRIASFEFAFMGIAMFGSSYFTALNNGLISAVIAFLRTMVFQIAFVFLMPLIWGADGIWASLIGAEFVCAILVIVFLLVFEKRYGYGFWVKGQKMAKKTDEKETEAVNQ